jgi:hypothetical protein
MQTKARGASGAEGRLGSEFAPPSLHPLGWAGSGRASSGEVDEEEEREQFSWSFQERVFAFELEEWDAEGGDYKGPLGPSPPLCGPSPPAHTMPELWRKTGRKEERLAEDFSGHEGGWEKETDTSILSQASTVCRVI